MKIVVCIRQGRDGEIGPFDACAYEEALRIPGAEVTLLSMGVPATAGFLSGLTRLGAKNALLLTDPGFAGADTLATAYTLSLAIEKLSPDLVFCGRQTLEGDTGQVPPMTARKLGSGYIPGVMQIEEIGKNSICCRTRDGRQLTADFPAVLTFERINTLRLPSIRSTPKNVECKNLADLGADPKRCGFAGSPTRVIHASEKQEGYRKCTFISEKELPAIIESSLKKQRSTATAPACGKKLDRVFAVGEETLPFAQRVAADVTLLPKSSPDELKAVLLSENPTAVLFGSDAYGKETAAFIAADLDLGLCADCTDLETDGTGLFMIRPALSGSVMAKIRSLTVPALATVRTVSRAETDLVVCAGYGVRDRLDEVRAYAESIGAEMVTTRKMVDGGFLPYDRQVGLTGKRIAPAVYIAMGVSGAVHHVVGMESAGTVIALNTDPAAPIFKYADYGILIKK